MAFNHQSQYMETLFVALPTAPGFVSVFGAGQAVKIGKIQISGVNAAAGQDVYISNHDNSVKYGRVRITNTGVPSVYETYTIDIPSFKTTDGLGFQSLIFPLPGFIYVSVAYRNV